MAQFNLHIYNTYFKGKIVTGKEVFGFWVNIDHVLRMKLKTPVTEEYYITPGMTNSWKQDWKILTILTPPSVRVRSG